jgi:hypothetical protein
VRLNQTPVTRAWAPWDDADTTAAMLANPTVSAAQQLKMVVALPGMDVPPPVRGPWTGPLRTTR